MSNWFKQLFGFSESRVMSETQKQFAYSPQEQCLTSLANGRSFQIGSFSTPTLHQLREEGLHALKKLTTTTPTEGTKVSQEVKHHGLAFHHVVHGDVLLQHHEFPGALFQAASQFNCLEFPNSRVTPEQGITDYCTDRTQGPACALACAAGTVVRNYFATVPPQQMSDGKSLAASVGQIGQSRDLQINNLDEFERAVGNDRHRYFAIKNGYTFSDDEHKLQQLGTAIRSWGSNTSPSTAATKCGDDAVAEAVKGVDLCKYQQESGYEQLLGTVKIGWQQDVGVTFKSRWEEVSDDAKTAAVVSQCYCSALSCAYSGIRNEFWEPFAQLVLDANYEATLWAAVLNAAKHERVNTSENNGSSYVSSSSSSTSDSSSSSSSGSDSGSSSNRSRYHDVVFLTFLGGGVFGNDAAWITSAIGRALALMTLHRAPIEVRIGHFRELDESKVEMIQTAYEGWLQILSTKSQKLVRNSCSGGSD